MSESPLPRELALQSCLGDVVEPIAQLSDREVELIRPLSSLSDEAIWEGLARALRVFARLEGERLRHET